ncbi:MAG: O-antigen ligase family protein [Candidatus Delongbacteria bacterium]
MPELRTSHLLLTGDSPQLRWWALGLSILGALCVSLAFTEPLWLLGPIFVLLAFAGILARQAAPLLLGLYPALCVHHNLRLNVLFVLLGLLLLVLERAEEWEPAKSKAMAIAGLELGLVIAAVLALHPVPFATHPVEAFGQWLYDYSPVLLYVLIVRSGFSARLVPMLVRLLLVAILAASVTVVVDGLLHPNTRAVGWVERMPTGTAYDLVMFVPIGLGMFASGRSRVLGLATALLALAAIFFTGSRAPFAVALLLALPFARGQRWALPALLAVLTLAMIQTGGGIVSRMASIEGEAGLIDASTLLRIVVWGLSIKILMLHPLLGIGFGQFISYASSLFIFDEFLLGHSHNIVLEKMVQVGIPLALFYLALIGLLLRRNWRTYRALRDRLDRADVELFRGLFFGALAMLACGALDAVLNGSNQPLAFWMIMALLTVWTEGLGRTQVREAGQ